MVRVRRGTGVVLWIRASARRKWNASMRLDGDADPEADEAGEAARRLGLEFGGGGGGGRAVLFRAMKRPARRGAGGDWRRIKRERESSGRRRARCLKGRREEGESDREQQQERERKVGEDRVGRREKLRDLGSDTEDQERGLPAAFCAVVCMIFF